MKNYFYFSREQKIGVTVLLCLIVLLLAANWLLPRFFADGSEMADKNFAQQVADFKASLKDEEQKRINRYNHIEERKLFAFDPNTLDSVGFVSLGIRPKIAHNILRYREKGGSFRSASDFAKIYGISESQFSDLKPYITIVGAKNLSPKNFSPRNENVEAKDISPQKMLIVELNTADTTELKKIRGIGSVFAKRIVEYREKLGGYARKEQLKEVKGIKPEIYENVEKYFSVDTLNIKQIAVNKASVERMMKHPYLHFYVAKAIYDQRRKLGKLNSAADLENLKDLPPEKLEKVLPYLSFEQQ
ncbi:MAG: helix-hairpin-helix domain-containing protein [Prevotellaceae bacterium]|jgi:competence ComEA-like helix-hairpin-helix protein|nr:helix-hairpin-helix domain-containing protein [Prevotellaceae bacterium]